MPMPPMPPMPPVPPMPGGSQIPRASARWKASSRTPDGPVALVAPVAPDVATVSQRLDELHAHVEQNGALLLKLTDTVSSQSTSLARLTKQLSALLGDRTNRIVRGGAVASRADAADAEVDADVAPTVL